MTALRPHQWGSFTPWYRRPGERGIRELVALAGHTRFVTVTEYQPLRPTNLSECESCGAQIAFVRVQPKLAWKPVDVEPHPEGTYLLVGDGCTAIWLLDERLEREQFMSR